MTSDYCPRCSFIEFANEVKARGDEVFYQKGDFGYDVFVIPRGEKPDFKLRRDGTCSPQRKLWLCDIPDKCNCSTKLALKYKLDWKPDPTDVEIDEAPVADPEEPREPLSLVV